MEKRTWVATAGGHRIRVLPSRFKPAPGDPPLVRMEIGGECALLTRSDVEALAAALLAQLASA